MENNYKELFEMVEQTIWTWPIEYCSPSKELESDLGITGISQEFNLPAQFRDYAHFQSHLGKTSDIYSSGQEGTALIYQHNLFLDIYNLNKDALEVFHNMLALFSYNELSDVLWGIASCFPVNDIYYYAIQKVRAFETWTMEYKMELDKLLEENNTRVGWVVSPETAALITEKIHEKARL